MLSGIELAAQLIQECGVSSWDLVRKLCCQCKELDGTPVDVEPLKTEHANCLAGASDTRGPIAHGHVAVAVAVNVNVNVNVSVSRAGPD